jgi:hypothetical protein
MEKVFEQMVTFADRANNTTRSVTQQEYNTWRQEYTFLALRGQRFGQSFCNTFGVTDNHLYYNTGNVSWSEQYIKENYLEKS